MLGHEKTGIEVGDSGISLSKIRFLGPSIPLALNACALTCELGELILPPHALGAQRAFHRTGGFSFLETRLRVAFSF